MAGSGVCREIWQPAIVTYFDDLVFNVILVSVIKMAHEINNVWSWSETD